jgi:alpha-ketoglutarate-dependent taurine dioxygenase
MFIANVEQEAVVLPQAKRIKTDYLCLEHSMPLVISPDDKSVDLIAWVADQRQFIESSLARHGALLFRGFNLSEAPEFGQFVKAVSGELIEYRERTSPRRSVHGRVYTSTDYPASESIFPHNESSYNATFPMKIFFFCHTPATRGGSTPIADTRKIFERIEPEVRERFVEKKYLYVRNFGSDLGLPWQDVFQTADKAAVEAYCRNGNIECEWRGEDRLQTRQVRAAVARHPHTREWVWFNHATFFHISTLERRVRDALIKMVPEGDLPNNTYYGDGSSIEPAVLDTLRAAYQQELVEFSWRRGDVLMLDNMLTAHARQPFAGPRKILTAMSEPHSWDSL